VGEFVSLMAMLTSLVALSIDAMLPALTDIGSDLGVQRPNDNQLIISALFLGFAVGQLIYGPLSDRIGRKPGIYAGLTLFILGCILSIVAWSYPVMLCGRFLQGFGAAGPRIVTMALIRDRYKGRAMARIMSFVITIFVIVPTVAPALGQAVLLVANWRMIFGLLLALATIAFVWFGVRQPESLPPERRTPLSPGPLAAALKEVCRNRTTLGYASAAGLVFGAFLGYLNSAQQIFQIQFGLGTLFPLYFAALSVCFGAAAYVNARLVMRYGMRTLSRRSLQVLCGLSVAFFAFSVTIQGPPPLWTLMLWGSATFFCLGMVFGNFNAMAMEPFGHRAGLAAAFIGSFTTLIAGLLGGMIGQLYDGTVLPLIGGFAVLGTASLGAVFWTERRA